MLDRKPAFSTSVLVLKTQTPVAEGAQRFCFQHPDNPALCIKIMKPDAGVLKRSHTPFYKRWRPLYRYLYNENLGEAKAYRQSAIRKGRARIWEHLPRCYGWQDTDIGPGLVMEYYTSVDGKPAKTLETILLTEGLTPDIKSALHVLEEYLRETRLILSDFGPWNIILAADGKLKLIDCLALRKVRFYRYIKFLALRKTEKKLARLHMRVNKLIRNTPNTHINNKPAERLF